VPRRDTIYIDRGVAKKRTKRTDIEDDGSLAELGGFCRKMGREAHQGEIGLVVGDEYFAIRDFGEE